MAPPFLYRLSDREKDALLTEQAAMIERLAARVKELEALRAKPRKTSRNSQTPPSQDRTRGGGEKESRRRKPRPARPGSARTIERRASACPDCAADVLGQKQTCRHRYDHIDIPPIAPVVTRIELFGGRCAACDRRFRAAPPEDMLPGTPFGARVRSLLLYLHHSHHVGFVRLARMMAELFGLVISEGAIDNAFRRAATAMTARARRSRRSCWPPG